MRINVTTRLGLCFHKSIIIHSTYSQSHYRYMESEKLDGDWRKYSSR